MVLHLAHVNVLLFGFLPPKINFSAIKPRKIPATIYMKFFSIRYYLFLTACSADYAVLGDRPLPPIVKTADSAWHDLRRVTLKGRMPVILTREGLVPEFHDSSPDGVARFLITT